LNRLVGALGAVVLAGGSAALLRWSDSLALTYVFITVGVVVLAAVGIL
jgi:low affinity Fe/Cu permease